MNIIKYFLYIKKINNFSKIINFDIFLIKSLKKYLLYNYNKKNFFNNYYKNKKIIKKYKLIKKNEFFV
ncbi:hypothetical protein ACJEC8_01015 [Candidatus Carsonella ruddii]|uniref:hypothetical protein n=1 Tax=Carsonella ruddii TaxID=114186 RepID=UPI003D3867AC